jgi:anti-anti-sigma factor
VDLAPAPVPSLTLCTRGEGSAVIVELRGELDLTCSPDLRDQLLGLLRRRSARLVLDLSKVTYCDASGLAVLVGTARRASLLAGSVRLAAVSHQVDRALQVTGLHRHLDVFATVEAAIASPQGIMASPIGPAARDLAARVLPRVASGVSRFQRPTDVSQLRDATAALLTHADAWRDADPGRRFVPALRAMADAWRGGDNTALETAARSLMSALVRHPLSHSQAVAVSATHLRRALDGVGRPAVL